jgi:RNA polymerase sigma-70 factor, ECF subfamily
VNDVEEPQFNSVDGDLTDVLLAVGEGDPEAMNQLLEAVYGDLRRMCRNRLGNDPHMQALQPTELVHEVYVRLIDQRRVNWANRSHFFSVAARLIRRVLVDQVRSLKREKRGGTRRRVSLSATIPDADGRAIDVLALEEALTELAEINETAASIVEMRFFGGQTHEDIAYVLGTSERSIRRHWTFAKAWLYRHMSGGAMEAESPA